MTAVHVNLGNVGPKWPAACSTAVAHLNQLFRQNSINLSLSLGGKVGPGITVRTDPSIQGTALHGHNQTQANSSGQLLSSVVLLPVKVSINTPWGMREAGPGVLEVIVAHEFVHALGQVQHSSHLMSRTWTPVPGNSPAGDVLQGGGIKMPPLALAPDTVKLLQSIWP